MDSKLIFILLACLLTQSVLAVHASRQQLEDVVTKQIGHLLAVQEDGIKWTSFASYLGTHFISEYYVMSRWMNHNSTKFNLTTLTQYIRAQQFNDGSWANVVDATRTGDIDTSIFNYWALKASGVSYYDDALVRARGWIIANGGLAKAMTMTKWWLAMTGNYEWNDLPSIPLFVFTESWMEKFVEIKDQVSQWVYPHLLPMAYTRHTMLCRDLGANFQLRELWAVAPKVYPSCHTRDVTLATGTSVDAVIDRMFKINQPHGSFGAYTVSTLFSVIAMSDYAAYNPTSKYVPAIRTAMTKGWDFIEWMYFETGPSSYRGVLDDGHYWDTALIGGAILEARPDLRTDDRLINAGLYVAQQQQPKGGIPYGIDFWYAPDTDDTSEVVSFWQRLGPKFDPYRLRAVQWLKDMQNDDGGFGAFAKGCTGNLIVDQFTKHFSDSAEVFDPSSVDVTGHVLECWADAGDKSSNVERGIRYLKGKQLKDGSWLGRWGVNFVYGTGAAVVGLRRAGIPASDPVISKAVSWLLSKQNSDGGWGESVQSYKDDAWHGVGVSTPSQTAWSLLALIDCIDLRTPSPSLTAIQNGYDYLARTFNATTGWTDPSAVGTGHPGILYMQYPSYAQAWPLLAVARYLKYTR